MMKQGMPAKVRIINLAKIVLPTAVILGIFILAVPIVVFYKVSQPGPSEEPLDPSYYLLESSDIRATSKDGSEINGCWITGQEGAAGIVLSPGYGMSRSDVLSLATALHEKGFNILIYGQRGSGAYPRKISTFGFKESEDILTAIQFVQSRPESGTRTTYRPVMNPAFPAVV